MNVLVAICAAVLVIGGFVLFGVSDEVAVRAIAMGVIGVGGVLGVAYVFLLVGRSEDRERRP